MSCNKLTLAKNKSINVCDDVCDDDGSEMIKQSIDNWQLVQQVHTLADIRSLLSLPSSSSTL